MFALCKIYSRPLPESKSLGEREREGALEFTALEVFAFGILLGAAFTLGTGIVLGLAPTSPGGGGRGGGGGDGRGGGAGEKGGREEKGEGGERRQEEVEEEGQEQPQYLVLSMYRCPPW
eukprot:s3321_g3.t1